MKPVILLLPLVALSIWGCDEIFEKDLTGRPVEVLVPAANTVLPEGDVTFLWKAVEDADSYRLLIVSPSFRQAATLVADTTVGEPGYTQSGMKPGTYSWRVTPCNSAYEGTPREQSFRIETVQVP